MGFINENVSCNIYNTISSPITDPITGLTFTTVSKLRDVQIMPDRFIFFDDNFFSDLGLYTTTTTVTYDELGKATVTSGGRLTTSIVPKVPFICTKLRVSTNGSGSTYNVNMSGLYNSSADEYIEAVYDITSKKVRIECRASGTTNMLGEVTVETITPPYDIYCVFNKNTVSAYLDTGYGVRFITSADISSYFDLRTPSVLKSFKVDMGFFSGSSATWKIDRFQVGYFGQVGMRDQTIVTYKDGTPYIKDNKLYFSATSAGIGDGHCGVYTLDLETYKTEKIGMIFVYRSSKVYNDLATHIIFDETINKFKLLISTWGNGFGAGSSLDVLYKIVDENILYGINIIEDMTTLALTGTTSYNVYDPYMIYNSSDGYWYIAYTIVTDMTFSGDPFYTSLDKTKDFVTFTNIDDDSLNTGYEGTKMQKIGNNWYVFASNDTYCRVYDLTMTYKGNLNFEMPLSTYTQPHAMVVPINKNGKTNFILMSFDTTKYSTSDFTWGCLVIEEATETEDGYEFPIKIV